VAIDEAKKTLHGIHGVEITDMTAKVDPKVNSSLSTHAKQYVRDKDNTSGRGSKIGSH
jgi:hypothetical protein